MGKPLGRPCDLPEKRKIAVAIFLNKSYEEVSEATQNILAVNRNTFNYIARTYDNVSSIRANTLFSEPFYYVSEEGIVYDKVEACLIALLIPEDQENAIKIWNKCSGNIINAYEYFNRSAELYNEYLKILEQNTISYTPINWKELFTYGKKLKLKITREKSLSLIIIEFGKVTIGNDIEGYIKYKNIILTFDDNFTLKRSQFFFTNWEYDSDLGLDWSLHPHIKDYICYGNRKEDFVIYQSTKNFAFLLDLIKESVNSYYPDQPFISVKKLASRLRAMERALPLHKAANPESERVESLLEFAEAHTRYCDCGNYMINNRCTGITCRRNPEAQLNCAHCNTPLVWSAEHNILICPQQGCENHVLTASTTANTDDNSIIYEDSDALMDAIAPDSSHADSEAADIITLEDVEDVERIDAAREDIVRTITGEDIARW